ncbi:MAG: hypothetical protein ACI87E_002236 [Mariniblastus sp.]|jgi:hypothetical protein
MISPQTKVISIEAKSSLHLIGNFENQFYPAHNHRQQLADFLNLSLFYRAFSSIGHLIEPIFGTLNNIDVGWSNSLHAQPSPYIANPPATSGGAAAYSSGSMELPALPCDIERIELEYPNNSAKGAWATIVVVSKWVSVLTI